MDYERSLERANATKDERRRVDRAMDVIKQAVNDGKKLTDFDRWMIEQALLKYARAMCRPQIDRKAVKQVADKVASLSRKAADVEHDLRNLADGLAAVLDGSVNLAACAALDASRPVSEALKDLVAAAEQMQRAVSDVKNVAPYQRKIAARREFTRSVLLADLIPARDLADWAALIEQIAEEVEGAIGKGEGEWLLPMIREIATEHDLVVTSHGINWKE